MKVSSAGLDKIIQAMERLEGNTTEIAHKAVYEAAGQIADEVKNGLRALPIQENANGRAPYMKPGHKLTGITSSEKADLIEGLGISPHREESGAVTASIGFDGYGSVPTKRWPQGVPIPLMMRSIESGTSFRQKHPVIRPAVNRVRKKAEETLKKRTIEEIKKEI